METYTASKQKKQRPAACSKYVLAQRFPMSVANFSARAGGVGVSGLSFVFAGGGVMLASTMNANCPSSILKISLHPRFLSPLMLMCVLPRSFVGAGMPSR